jgi:hypothetical protein
MFCKRTLGSQFSPRGHVSLSTVPGGPFIACTGLRGASISLRCSYFVFGVSSILSLRGRKLWYREALVSGGRVLWCFSCGVLCTFSGARQRLRSGGIALALLILQRNGGSWGCELRRVLVIIFPLTGPTSC